MSYDGITPLDDAIAFDLKLCKRRDPNKLSKLKKQACGALGIEFVKQGGKKPPAYNVAIYEWLKSNKPATPIPELDNDIDPPAPIPEVVPITQLVNDVVPIVEPAPLELNIIQSTDCDKFISINYRHADNSRHTVQLEKFYIDALKAIGIDDVSKFVAENAGVATVTKNVKRAIVFELVKRANMVKK